MKNYSILVLFIIYCFSCKNQQNIDEYTLIPSGGIISFEVPNDCKNSTSCLQYYSDSSGETFLCYLNDDFNKILFYEFSTQNLSSEIEMPQRGPNGVGGIRSFVVHNLDSILLTTGQMNVLFLIDSSGVVKNKFKAGNIMNGEHNVYFQHSSTVYRNLNIKSGNIFIGTHLLTFPGPEEIQKFKLCLKIDMKNNNQELLPLKYPSLGSRDKEAVYSSFGAQIIGNRFIYSFRSSHNIFITEDHETFQTLPAKSKFIKEDFKLPDLQSGYHSIVKSNLEHPMYGSLIYDPYRNVYYRFVYPGVNQDSSIEAMSIQKLMDASRFKPIFSVMILDSTLEIIGEKSMPQNTYDWVMTFVNKDGLYISDNHPQNPNFDGNRLRFELFELVKSEEY